MKKIKHKLEVNKVVLWCSTCFREEKSVCTVGVFVLLDYMSVYVSKRSTNRVVIALTGLGNLPR